MNGISKIVGIATLGTLGLTGCSNIDKNKQICRDGGITAKTFDSIEKLSSWRPQKAENWQKAADSMRWSAKFESAAKKAYFEGQQAVRDSLKHIKP